MSAQQLETLILSDQIAASLFAEADREQLWRELASIKLRLGEMD